MMSFKNVLIVFLLILAVIVSLYDRYISAKHMGGTNKILLLLSFFIVLLVIILKKS